MRSLNGFKIVFFIAQVDIQDMPMELGAQDNCMNCTMRTSNSFFATQLLSVKSMLSGDMSYMYIDLFLMIFFGVCRYANL